MLYKAVTSCLSPKDVKALQFEPYAEGHELEIYPSGLAGFKLPYFTLDGKVDPSIYRFRLLQVRPSKEKGWASVKTDPAKPRRYTQPQGTNCGVYLAPLLGASWKEISKDASTPILITEGELKAACACKLGYPTLGLGGVYNWRSSKEGYELLPILEKFVWRDRKVYIAFDSDTKTNPMVRMAASRLAWTLGVRSAIVHIIDLPEGEEAKKQGLDDLVFATATVKGRGAKDADRTEARSTKIAVSKDAARSTQASKRLIDLAPEAQLASIEYADFSEGQSILDGLIMNSQSIGPGKELHRLNSEVGLVRKTNEIIEILTGNVYTPAAFSDSVYKNRVYNELDDNNRLLRKFAAKEWLAIEHRTEFSEYAYDPSCNRIVTDDGAYNTWFPQRWPLEPSRHRVDPATGKRQAVSLAPWEQLFNHVFSTLTEAQRHWVKCWFAYPIQHPGTKLYTALLVWGRTTGTGKSRIGETMKSIYGKNYTVINNAHLTANFNEWAENKQFIVGDEISIGDKRGVANTLKGMITSEIIRLNIKNRKSYTVSDCINYYFSSNHEDAIYLENHDRRFFIVHADIGRLSAEFYSDYMRWLEHEGGAARLFHYLKYEVNTEAHELVVPAGTPGAVRADASGYPSVTLRAKNDEADAPRGKRDAQGEVDPTRTRSNWVLSVPAFNPKGEAPTTEAKLAMMATGRSDVEDWAFGLKLDPDKQLSECGQMQGPKRLYDLYTTKELLRFYDPDDKGKVRSNGMARALNAAGIFKCANGSNHVQVAGSRDVVYAIRHPEKYLRLGPAEISKLYAAERGGEFKPPSERVGASAKFAPKVQ